MHKGCNSMNGMNLYNPGKERDREKRPKATWKSGRSYGTKHEFF